jgi:hypothetical protein
MFVVKKIVVKALNALVRPFGAKIVRVGSGPAVIAGPGPSNCYMENEELSKMLLDELSGVSRTFFLQRLPGLAPTGFDFRAEVEKFMSIYRDRQRQNNVGGSGFHNSFWIFLTARALDPELIVESGVWKGHTSKLFEQACPNATIHGFDINLGKLEYKTGCAQFHEYDWSCFGFGNVNPNKSLVFFDCHINHARRLLEARARGFKHLIFDDNPPLHKLYAYGRPGFPTANMLHSGLPANLSEVRWRWQGKQIDYTLNRAEAEAAAKVIAQHEVYPDVSGPTRYGALSYSFLTYVRIK